jgi:protein disulfide-isomerase A1
MRYVGPICAVLAAVALASDVHELKKDTFKSFVQENDLVLAECKYFIALIQLLRQFQS